MLAFFSDIHLTDGTTARNVEEGAFHYLNDAIISASKREIREVHIVMLGDIFDLVRTDYWHAGDVPMSRRPWGGIIDPATGMNSDTETIELQFNAILEAILATPAGRAFVGMIDNLPALIAGPIRVTFVAGNHDRVFNNFASLRAQLTAAMPNVQVAFTNGLIAPEYGVLARHGHEWDEVCHGWKFARRVLRRRGRLGQFDEDAYKVMAIGEPITAELMSGLIFHVRRSIAAKLDARDPQALSFYDNLLELNNLRPISHLFHWLAWITRQQYVEFGECLLAAVREALGTLLGSPFARRWDRITPDFLWWGDTVHHLNLLRMLLATGISFEKLAWLVATGVTLKSAIGIVLPHDDDDDLVRGAHGEFAQRDIDPRIQYVVYGHTHEARHDCFSAPTLTDPVRMYINTGTYLPLIERSRDGTGYLTTGQMTMAFFYSEDEDTHNRAAGGPTLAVWNGIRRKKYE